MNITQNKTALPEAKHAVTLENRNRGSIDGVTKVVSAYPDAINLVTSKGALTVSGKDLKILKFDADTGRLSFDGEVNALKYDGGKKPLLKRIFK